jgi:hypothetical protein
VSIADILYLLFLMLFYSRLIDCLLALTDSLPGGNSKDGNSTLGSYFASLFLVLLSSLCPPWLDIVGAVTD